MSDQNLRDFAGELVGVARASGVSDAVAVIACEAIAYAPQRIRARGDVERLQLLGDGSPSSAIGAGTSPQSAMGSSHASDFTAPMTCRAARTAEPRASALRSALRSIEKSSQKTCRGATTSRARRDSNPQPTG
ncbi:MAG: hypothetical protein KGP12_07775 [Actinomycetales bacterium]|nr:hypothetical protein [Actinomycetales bacterium]